MTMGEPRDDKMGRILRFQAGPLRERLLNMMFSAALWRTLAAGAVVAVISSLAAGAIWPAIPALVGTFVVWNFIVEPVVKHLAEARIDNHQNRYIARGLPKQDE